MNDNVNFIHIRERDAQGRATTHGGFTVAYTQYTPASCVIATAMCNEKDNFSRRIGRAIAGGRLTKGLEHLEMGLNIEGLISDVITLDPAQPLSKKELYARVLEHLRSGK